MRQVKGETVGTRPTRLSERHRLWGWDCPAVDIDLFVEFDNGEPVAIIEYRGWDAWKTFPVDPDHPTYSALIEVADRAEIGFFAVRYTDDFLRWEVRPMNLYAREALSALWPYSLWKRRGAVVMTEEDYVSFLYQLRGKVPPPHLEFGRDGRLITKY